MNAYYVACSKLYVIGFIVFILNKVPAAFTVAELKLKHPNILTNAEKRFPA